MYTVNAFRPLIEPVYANLFNTALMITGDYRSALDSLNEALASAFHGRKRRAKRALWASLEKKTRAAALKNITEKGSGAVFYGETLAALDGDTARALVLTGMRFSPRRASAVTGVPVSEIVYETKRITKSALKRACREALNEKRGVPDPEASLRAVKSGQYARAGRRSPGSAVYAAFTLVFLLVFCALIFIAASVNSPSRLERDTPTGEQAPAQTFAPF